MQFYLTQVNFAKMLLFHVFQKSICKHEWKTPKGNKLSVESVDRSPAAERSLAALQGEEKCFGTTNWGLQHLPGPEEEAGQGAMYHTLHDPNALAGTASAPPRRPAPQR